MFVVDFLCFYFFFFVVVGGFLLICWFSGGVACLCGVFFLCVCGVFGCCFGFCLFVLARIVENILAA